MKDLIHVNCQSNDFLHCQSIITVRSFKTFDFNHNYFQSHTYDWL